jgi:hypothetical protein
VEGLLSEVDAGVDEGDDSDPEEPEDPDDPDDPDDEDFEEDFFSAARESLR